MMSAAEQKDEIANEARHYSSLCFSRRPLCGGLSIKRADRPPNLP